MFVKNNAFLPGAARVCLVIVYTALGFGILYNGISCFMTLYKACTQPHLLAGTMRFDFMGYYMTAAVHGGLCVGLTMLIVLLLLRKRLKLKKTGRIKGNSNRDTGD